MDLRKVYISTSGNMIDYMTDARIDDTLDKVMDGMSQRKLFCGCSNLCFGKLKHLLIRGSLGVNIVWTAKQVKITRYKVITPLGNGNCTFAAAPDTQLDGLGINISTNIN